MAVGIGCPVRDARKLVYADGYDLENLEAAVPIGTTCRLCERLDCEQRAFPPMQHGLKVDENVRGRSRSEERRVGKECGCRRGPSPEDPTTTDSLRTSAPVLVRGS